MEPLQLYDVEVNGAKTRLYLSEQDAREMGVYVEDVPVAEPPAPADEPEATKARAPANKSRRPVNKSG